MFFEASSLASIASAMGQALRTYGCDPEPLMRQAGLDPDKISVPGWRFPLPSMVRLWELAREEVGDPGLGLRVGEQIRPAHLHALGLAWMASSSVRDALQRLIRYQKIISTVADIELRIEGPESMLRVNASALIRVEAVDAFFASILSLCRMLVSESFRPLQVGLAHEDPGNAEAYRRSFRAPVAFSCETNEARFRTGDIETLLPAGNPELAHEVDSIAERYLRTIKVAPTVARVRSILVDLLPSGSASQEAVASRMNASISTLRRNLRAEGTSYRAVLDATRKDLAERYVRDGRYTLGEVAFLLGFADQSSMTRAFKRWTGSPPGRYRA
jgi:AraC-like DNA-binding protein